MKNMPAPRFAYGALVICLALLAFIAMRYADQADKPRPNASLHLTQADWQVQDSPGFSTPPMAWHGSDLPGTWRPVTLPLALPIDLMRQAEFPAATQTTRVTWIRLMTPRVPGGPGPLALYGARIKTDGTIAVYVDGRMVHRAQQEGPLWNSTRTPLWVVLDKPEDGAPAAKAMEILIRLEHSQDTQVALSSLWLGQATALRPRYHVRQWLQQELPGMLNAAFLAVGLFALFVWFKRRHESSYMFFFVLATVSFLRGLHFYVPVPIANDWFAWLTVNSLLWLVTVVHLFICRLHGRPLRVFSLGMMIAAALVGLLTLPVLAIWPNTPKLTPLIYAATGLTSIIVSIIGWVLAGNHSNEARLVSVGLFVCTLFGVSDWAVQNNVISPEGWYLGAYANAITFATFGILMYRRYVAAVGEVERVNASLARRLQVREAELEISHRLLHEAGLRQTISEERQRLMQDMHDGLGSSLISAIRLVDHGGLSDQKFSQVLKTCLDDLKLAIDSMEPIEANLLLLLATLRFRMEPRLEGAGISLLWEVQELPALDWLDRTSALHILRIIQESLSNILHHTLAVQIRVGTSLEAGGVQVSIEDNGQGFDVEKALGTPSGRGLHNQRRRAEAIGGKVAWHSGPGGTRFTLWVPLERAASIS
ncbi:MAG TPA: sensor histidine kinase [Luteibacter sp.]|jgi:signal transduction histidine kinase|nr:sensor histidine kinase [Luteibacter sp.]